VLTDTTDFTWPTQHDVRQFFYELTANCLYWAKVYAGELNEWNINTIRFQYQGASKARLPLRKTPRHVYRDTVDWYWFAPHGLFEVVGITPLMKALAGHCWPVLCLFTQMNPSLYRDNAGRGYSGWIFMRRRYNLAAESDHDCLAWLAVSSMITLTKVFGGLHGVWGFCCKTALSEALYPYHFAKNGKVYETIYAACVPQHHWRLLAILDGAGHHRSFPKTTPNFYIQNKHSYLFIIFWRNVLRWELSFLNFRCWLFD